MHPLLSSCTRRGFFGAAAEFAGALAFSGMASQARDSGTPLAQRRLGRTGVNASLLGLGLGPVGLAHYSPFELREVVQAALDEGVTYFDMQPDYGDVECSLAPWLHTRRDRVFLVTKTWAKTRNEALDSIQRSVRRLHVKHVDAVLLNNIGDYDMERLFAPEGAFAGMEKAQELGLTRFLGISGHMGAEHFVQALQTGRFDVVMPVINFVDRHSYRMEEKVLPVAAKHDVGVVAMKVLGGAVGKDYSSRQQHALLPAQDHEAAIRYALGLAGVSVAVIGCKSADEVRLAAAAARNFRPLEAKELDALLDRGRRLATGWGLRFGPA